ncbi:hypothetical protein BDV32DRAFT_110079 [Aspergillus pseudonomiae]|uniref:Uncharacterized protein n=1 Tax=Aspergillus pseudonomiae TaxID=1506151 RepID=A0A5N7DPL9_9EURO|nr:uncharacterized protein BDV37DRAFT_171909 [Aspergillus pseudonomiae]KAB8263514.1 hypothetical protein BDV32DRAFT_110079 [Aspergillus pseudonomiae]KAE8408374.1 hypothetical protein BDV37DRAFT_171909 [Aspergillus pseudonomiae]
MISGAKTSIEISDHPCQSRARFDAWMTQDGRRSPGCGSAYRRASLVLSPCLVPFLFPLLPLLPCRPRVSTESQSPLD